MTKRRVSGVGIAVYPAHIPRDGKVHVGVWVCHPIPGEQRTRLMSLNETAGFGHVRVCSRAKRTTVMYIGPVAKMETETHRTPHQIAKRLARAVREVVGIKTEIRRLRNTALVSKALAI